MSEREGELFTKECVEVDPVFQNFSIVCNFVSIVEVKLASGPLRIRENSKLLLAL